MTDAGADLIDRARVLDAELRAHKRAMRRHRQDAQQVRAELDRIADECARRGIALFMAPDGRPGRM